MKNLALIFAGYKEVGWIIREMMEDCNSYDCAMERILTEPMITSGYFVLAGT